MAQSSDLQEEELPPTEPNYEKLKLNLSLESKNHEIEPVSLCGVPHIQPLSSDIFITSLNDPMFNSMHSAQWPLSKRCSQRPGRRPDGILPPREHAESTEHWSHLELTLVMHSLWVGFAVKDPLGDQKRREHAGSTGRRGTWRSQPGKDDNTGLFFCRAAYNAQWIKQWSRSYVQHDDRCQHNYQK